MRYAIIDGISLLGLGKGEPHHEDKLKGVVEGEPIYGTDSALEDTSESQYIYHCRLQCHATHVRKA
jgi:hypothetical protein